MFHEMKKENIILQLSFEFALKTIDFCEQLESRRKYVIAKQLLKSGTSIGANIREAQSAESRKDFIHKLKIAAKEGEETAYWLLLCNLSENYPDCKEIINDLLRIQKLLSKIIFTSKMNINKSAH